jgi:hypothetical protein
MADQPPFLPGDLVLLPLWMSRGHREAGLIVEARPTRGRYWHVAVLTSPSGDRSAGAVYNFAFCPDEGGTAHSLQLLASLEVPPALEPTVI